MSRRRPNTACSFPEEPIPADSRLLTTLHIVMTPHIAGASKQTAEKAARIAAGEVRRFLQRMFP
jgi:D-3-phosphoglycerate dehydrogenase / 2-oxoglutarate reductase